MDKLICYKCKGSTAVLKTDMKVDRKNSARANLYPLLLPYVLRSGIYSQEHL